MPHTPATHRRSRPDDLDRAAAEFAELRPRLTGVASRILGDRTEAEDVVQEAWLRWQTCDRNDVRNPTAYLVTTTTRLAINTAQSARARRESTTGEWPAEPVDPAEDPGSGVERTDSVAHALVVLLAGLTPAERAAYVLRQAFEYPYPRIAGLLDLTEANARQHVSRAGTRLKSGRRHRVSPREHRRLLRAFESAARLGDVALLEDVLVTEPEPTLSLSAP